MFSGEEIATHSARIPESQPLCPTAEMNCDNTALYRCLIPTKHSRSTRSPTPVSRKRPRLLSNSSEDDDEIQFHELSHTPASSDICSFPSFLNSEEDIEYFLNDLSEQIYRGVLENLCPDNMRGSFCRTPDTCLSEGFFFACPSFATLRRCKTGSPGALTHSGYKHTVRGCQVNDKVECGKTHPDGRLCRVRVVYFHVRAACITLRGGNYCQQQPCGWGHDYKDIRRQVMSAKRSNS